MMCKLEITSDGVQWSSFVVYDPVTIKGTGLREHFFLEKSHYMTQKSNIRTEPLYVLIVWETLIRKFANSACQNRC